MAAQEQKASHTGSWSLWFDTKGGVWNLSWKRENMKPHQGKHETLNRWPFSYRFAARKTVAACWYHCGCTPTARTQEHQEEALQFN